MVTTRRVCKGKKATGEACGSPPLLEGEYCLLHDPEHADEVQEARRLGGQRRRKERVVADAFDFEGLGSIPSIRRLVEVAAMDTLGLENSVARARTLAYLAQVATKLLETGELEERVAQLEAAVAPRVNEVGR